MKKVLHLIHGLNAGGAEMLVSNYFLFFNHDEIDYTLLCLEHREEFAYEGILKNAGVDIIYVEDYLPFRRSENIICRLINSMVKRIVVRKIIREKSPDIIHTHLRINSFLRFAEPKLGTVIFMTVHSDPNKVWGVDRKSKKDYRAVRWAMKRYDTYFIALHEEMSRIVCRKFGTLNLIILNNGVDIEKIKHTRRNITIRKELGIPVDAFVLGHIGRFSIVKNQEFLVDILIEVRKKNKNAFLLMVGDGADKSKIKMKLDRNGMRGKYLILSNRSDVPDLLNTMNVFVFPSLYEGLPLSLIEAQVAKKPCFISDNVNESAIISNLITRLSLEQSPKEWSDAILSYKKPKRVIVNENDWDIKKVTKRLEDIYLRALEKKDEK